MSQSNELLNRINERYSHMSKGQKMLSTYITDNYDKAVFLTADKLGKVVGVSESTVVRYATFLGYKGYPEFQKALEELVRNKLNSIQRMEVTAVGICMAAGILGGFLEYTGNGMNDEVLTTGAFGIGAGILLYLLHLTTDEKYSVSVVRNYMVDYLENVCLHRYEKAYQKETESKGKAPQEPQSELQVNRQPEPQMHIQSEMESTALPQPKSQPNPQPQPELTAPLQPEPIPRVLPVSDLRRQEVTVSEQEKQEKQVEEKKETPAKEVLIRQILEEFMA